MKKDGLDVVKEMLNDLVPVEVKKKADVIEAVKELQQLKLLQEKVDNTYQNIVSESKSFIKGVEKDFRPIWDKLASVNDQLRTDIVSYQTTHEDADDISGLSWREKTEIYVSDANRIPQEYLIPDMSKLRQAHENGLANIPGTDTITKYIPVITKVATHDI